MSGILSTLAQGTRLSLFHAEDIGRLYARTLEQWRERFHAALPEVRKAGFDERFERMWDFYLAYCEGAFRERHISDMQLLLSKSYNRRSLLGEPWPGAEQESGVVAAQP